MSTYYAGVCARVFLILKLCLNQQTSRVRQANHCVRLYAQSESRSNECKLPSLAAVVVVLHFVGQQIWLVALADLNAKATCTLYG